MKFVSSCKWKKKTNEQIKMRVIMETMKLTCLLLWSQIIKQKRKKSNKHTF